MKHPKTKRNDPEVVILTRNTVQPETFLNANILCDQTTLTPNHPQFSVALRKFSAGAFVKRTQQ